jgi:hypothetical protein
MRKNILIIIGLMLIAQTFITGCKKDENIKPEQNKKMEMIDLGNAELFAIIAGSSITNTGETEITGDLASVPALRLVDSLQVF